MGRKRFHGLKKLKIRASWNKYNLYNLSRLPPPRNQSRTFYQQKWGSKSMTRAYHGEQIREKQWQRMFTSKLDAVIPMDHRYLAQHDGSELAAGRGSGLDQKPKRNNLDDEGPRPVPYMNMTYAPIERRLDMAIFRALFASSLRQARQLVVHHKVKVNGQKMPYPGYLLNPGDMYQVDVDSVMYATGAVKPASQRAVGRGVLRKQRRINSDIAAKKAGGAAKRKAALAQAAAEGKDSRKKSKKPRFQDNLVERGAIKDEFQTIIDQTRYALDNIKKRGRWRVKVTKTALKGKAESANVTSGRAPLLALRRKVNDVVGQIFQLPLEELENKYRVLKDEWTAMQFQLPRQALERSKLEDETKARLKEEKRQRAQSLNFENTYRWIGVPGPELDEWRSFTQEKRDAIIAQRRRETDERKRRNAEKDAKLEEELSVKLKEALAVVRTNPTDSGKPYATPWEPRPYMSAFAFIPRYLEVNHAICSAVYLRHPVARPGLAEVPSPFPTETLQLAFNWYLRRR